MVKKNIKVVIGANFGDEGKGLMTDYFCHQSALRGENSIVVCHNGGAQRGHTVDTLEGLHHIFRHFGSGTFAGSDTYFSKEFILNPIIFHQEYEELKELGYVPKVYVNNSCKVSTPFDMILNQILEEKRSNNRHGSCGLGIFETIERHKSESISPANIFLPNYDGLNCMNLRLIRDKYFSKRMIDLGISLDNEWEEIFYNKRLIENYLNDLDFMNAHTAIANDSILEKYQNIVFEGGQGLLLDQNNKEYFPHLTPSNTGLENPKEMILRLFPDSEVEVCYVSRTYITRHGAGRLDNECVKEEINPDIEDFTNVQNLHQGLLRYGKMNVTELIKRIQKDFSYDNNWKVSISITHRNETNGVLDSIDKIGINEIRKNFDIIYDSFGKIRESVSEQYIK